MFGFWTLHPSRYKAAATWMEQLINLWTMGWQGYFTHPLGGWRRNGGSGSGGKNRDNNDSSSSSSSGSSSGSSSSRSSSSSR